MVFINKYIGIWKDLGAQSSVKAEYGLYYLKLSMKNGINLEYSDEMGLFLKWRKFTKYLLIIWINDLSCPQKVPSGKLISFWRIWLFVISLNESNTSLRLKIGSISKQLFRLTELNYWILRDFYLLMMKKYNVMRQVRAFKPKSDIFDENGSESLS